MDFLRLSLPSPENRQSLWITHFSPAIIYFLKDNKQPMRQKAYLALDRTALYMFLLPSGGCCGAAANSTNFLQYRIPLLTISRVEVKDTDDNDVIIHGPWSISSARMNIFTSTSQTSVMTLGIHTTRRTEVLQVLRRTLNSLTFGDPPGTKVTTIPFIPHRLNHSLRHDFFSCGRNVNGRECRRALSYYLILKNTLVKVALSLSFSLISCQHHSLTVPRSFHEFGVQLLHLFFIFIILFIARNTVHDHVSRARITIFTSIIPPVPLQRTLPVQQLGQILPQSLDLSIIVQLGDYLPLSRLYIIALFQRRIPLNRTSSGAILSS